MSLIYHNVKGIYNKYAQSALSPEDLSRGADVPLQITSQIETRGLQHYMSESKEESKAVEKRAIKMAQPIASSQEQAVE
jgi:hypothetical protein